MRNLRRRAGIEVSSCAWLEVPWAKWRADPNGYYARLGLDPARAVLMCEIDTAWRAALRRLHPDTGSGDVLALARARVAYEVLSDPETRRQYDALGRGEVWLDELLMEEVIRVVTAGPEPLLTGDPTARKGGGGGGGREEAGGDGRGRTVAPVPPSSPQVYYWEGDEDAVPDEGAVVAWAAEIGRALWELFRESRPVKVGFTTGGPSVEARAWGTVYLIPAGLAPDPAVARAAAIAGNSPQDACAAGDRV